MHMAVNIILPRIMRIGAGASRELVEVLAQLGASRPLIVTDAFMVEHGPVRSLREMLIDAGLTVGVFHETVPDPTTESIDRGVAALKAGDYDCIVGVGGGSPLDSAKAIALLGVHGGRMRDYKVPRVNDAPGLPVVAIPTTAGTGSEVTRFTVITDSDSNEKMLCAGAAFCPIAALVDYELTLSMPHRLTADTGLDTLTHCIESYVSRKRNPFSDSMALAGMARVARHIRRACAEPGNREAREEMMFAATQGGMAFSNASVCLVHGMSRPVGAFFHVPHGLSNAMLLPRLTEFSAPAAAERYADCARAMGCVDTAADTDTAVAALVEELRALNRDLEVPTPKQYGIGEQDWFSRLETMAQQAEASGSPGNNPRVPSVEEMVSLYREVYA
jgi:alcohol dehydrogenase class IV